MMYVAIANGVLCSDALPKMPISSSRGAIAIGVAVYLKLNVSGGGWPQQWVGEAVISVHSIHKYMNRCSGNIIANL